ncbi:hypothetical protein R50073_15070 [Maricurvus nonylphenolicus]|uniref:VOC family protein n=1 Tax=Maricurvus nonylphenolicus TaxID=1008307 RepID=UPI0036F20218
MSSALPLCQIAMSVLDQPGTYAWYQQLFGFLPAGGTNSFRGPIASSIQGIPKAASSCWWLVDQQSQFQIELFQFESPVVRPQAKDWRPCDIGYSMVSLWVKDFDACLTRLDRLGGKLESAVQGKSGQRRACFRDPEGVLLEIMEEDIRARSKRQRPNLSASVAVRSVTMSVEDIERSAQLMGDIFGMQELDSELIHSAEHESLWGLTGAQRLQRVFDAGDMFIEIVQYQQPLGKKLPDDYRISDQGLLNIAFGFRSWREFNRVHKRCKANGILGNSRALHLGAWSVVYVNDQQGFSFELLMVKPWYDSFMGFKAKPGWKQSDKLEPSLRL